MIVGKIENGLERGFVKHRLNCLLITDPICLQKRLNIQSILPVTPDKIGWPLVLSMIVNDRDILLSNKSPYI